MNDININAQNDVTVSGDFVGRDKTITTVTNIYTASSESNSIPIPFSYARRRRKFENLQHIRTWMKAYQVLFECKYPTMTELLYPGTFPQSLNGDKTTLVRVYQALKDFREANTKYIQAERDGRDALQALGENEWLDKVFWPIDLGHMLLSGRKPHHHLAPYLKGKELLFIWYSDYPRGLPRKIARHLESLFEQRTKLFKMFPNKALTVSWDKLDFIEPGDVRSVFESHMTRENTDAYKALDSVELCRDWAMSSLESVLMEVVRQEKSLF